MSRYSSDGEESMGTLLRRGFLKGVGLSAAVLGSIALLDALKARFATAAPAQDAAYTDAPSAVNRNN